MLPIGGNGECGELARDRVHLVSGANQHERGDEHVEGGVAGHEDEHPVRVGRQPDMVLTCLNRDKKTRDERNGREWCQTTLAYR